MNTPKVHITRRGSVYVNGAVQSSTINPHERILRGTQDDVTVLPMGFDNINANSAINTLRMHQSDMDTKHGDIGSLVHPSSMRLRSISPLTSDRLHMGGSPYMPQRSQEQELMQRQGMTAQPSFMTPIAGGDQTLSTIHNEQDLLDQKDLRINIPASQIGRSSVSQHSEIGSPSKSIVQLYDIEFDRLKERCTRAENALGQSYRSLDKLNDLIVATDSSPQLANNNSVHALLDFFQQVGIIWNDVRLLFFPHQHINIGIPLKYQIITINTWYILLIFHFPEFFSPFFSVLFFSRCLNVKRDLRSKKLFHLPWRH